MMRLLFAFLALFTMFTSVGTDLPEKLKDEVMFNAYNQGNAIVISDESAKQIDKLFCRGLRGCRVLPALGVSLHDDTLAAVQEGVWLQFGFDRQLEVEGMPFDQLLVQITKDMYGFNVVRGNNGRYEGRCFFIDIKHNLDELYNYLLSLPVSEQKFDPNFNLKPQSEDVNQNNADSSEVLLQTLQEGGSIEAKAQTRFQIPSINKEKDKQNTVIKQDGQAKTGKRPPLDELTFKK